GEGNPRDEGLVDRALTLDQRIAVSAPQGRTNVGAPPQTFVGREPLRVRWLGRVPYREALAVQTALFDHGRGQHLLLLEHPHVFTHGRRTDLASNLRCEPAAVGAELVAVKRG